MSENAFLDNELVQDAVVRNIEIVGEAVSNIRRTAPNFVAANPVLPWSDICDMRNQLAHGYMTVDLKVVWNTVQRDIPTLEQHVQALRQGLDDNT